MDLYAYSQIADLNELATKNGIKVPRPRGYRLMSVEQPIDWKKVTENLDFECAEYLCRSKPFWSTHPYVRSYSGWTNFLVEYYCPNNNVRWDRIHGWKRRTLKTYIHNEKRRYQKQYETWNKYVGREDVLYIHARIGGVNWPYYYKEIVNQPCFIEKVDDAFDSTYCDIYVKIK